MPSMTAIVLADRETTPVNHTFTPSGIKDGVARFLNTATGVPVGFETLTSSMRQTGKRIKIKQVLQVPIIQTVTVNGVSSPVVVRSGFAETVFTFDETSTVQERKNLVGMQYASLGASQAMLNDLFTNLSPLY